MTVKPMSGNPQCEDGYTRIANELVDALMGIRIPGESRQILDMIFRKTYGFNKTEADISITEFSERTGIKKSNVIRALGKLLDMGIVIQKDNSIVKTYCIVKQYKKWKKLSKTITYSKRITPVIQKDNSSYPNGEPHKGSKDTLKTIKDTLLQKAADKPRQEVVDNYVVKTDTQRVVCCYKKAIGYAWNDRSWDKLNFARAAKSASQLLVFFGNDWRQAGECVFGIAQEMKAKSLTFTLETIVKHADRWKLEKKGDQNGLRGGPGNNGGETFQRSDRQTSFHGEDQKPRSFRDSGGFRTPGNFANKWLDPGKASPGASNGSGAEVDPGLPKPEPAPAECGEG